ncbi:hypothetical protein LSH36_729g01005 [Paralvinella palmiformis]|uniref:Uncharacterized protein n=1 Tax=Paralvinella palmiformis TaxID=53620 RepID=A0AAD9MTF8_9ANNE|nr:hypothetical protein LSH36_729g01005 [Paralvinella palmiformis]
MKVNSYLVLYNRMFTRLTNYCERLLAEIGRCRLCYVLWNLRYEGSNRSDFRLPEHRRRQIRRGFSFQGSTRPQISGTASGELRILGVTDTEAIHIRIIYIGKLKAGTSSIDIRSDLRDIGVSRVSDVIQLPCKVSGQVSFCVTMDTGLDGDIIFNAGLKSYYGVIDNYLNSKNCDIMFVCEHWLTEQELASFKLRFSGDNRRTHMKSSVNTEELLVGRLHCGVGFIANRLKNITYKSLLVDSDRIIGIQVVSCGKILLTVFGVYLPYYNDHNDQFQLYHETLDILQSATECKELSPMLNVRDMNANLPRHVQFSGYCYRQHPYNKHSYILYDCFRNNELKSSNFNFDQDVSYTYFNITSHSYIDHVFASVCAGDIIK